MAEQTVPPVASPQASDTPADAGITTAPATTAAIFWLKNRRPDKWRDIKAQEISGPDGAPLLIKWLEQ